MGDHHPWQIRNRHLLERWCPLSVKPRTDVLRLFLSAPHSLEEENHSFAAVTRRIGIISISTGTPAEHLEIQDNDVGHISFIPIPVFV